MFIQYMENILCILREIVWIRLLNKMNVNKSFHEAQLMFNIFYRRKYLIILGKLEEIKTKSNDNNSNYS